MIVQYDGPFNGGNYWTEKDLEVFVKNIPETLPSEDQSLDHVSIYFPGHSKFETYDVIVAFWERGGGNRVLYGYQLKEEQNTGKTFVYDQIFIYSHLIWGIAPAQSDSIRLFVSCSEAQVDNFFGLS